MKPKSKGIGWRTAIKRKALSIPMRYLVKKHLLMGRTLDYGCGRGYDADALKLEKYDPNWGPQELPEGEFDTIVCSYVLNVLPEEERKEVIENIRSKLKPHGVAYISVRADVSKDSKTQWDVYLDEYLLYSNANCRIYEVKK